MSSENTSSGGIGFIGLLQILFIALKLLKVIDWKWIWVLSPLWISGIMAVLVIIILICVLIIGSL